MPASNKRILECFVTEVWNQGALDRIHDYVAPVYTIQHDPGDPWDGKALTPEGLRERICISRAPFPDQRFETVHMIGEGDLVAFAWTWIASHCGDIPGFPATTKPVKMSGLTVYSFENGKINGHWQVVDRLGVFQQLSALKQNKN